MMNKNEYRRAFIMLRPAMTGFSGHVRLERRTMTGSMYFIVTAQGEGVNAALVGQRGGEYYAANLGALRRDGRGQLTLAYAFDPRSIDGRPLEAYQQIAVVQSDAEGCRLALTGNVDGAYPMDAAAVREAACALYQASEPAADLPSPETPSTGDVPAPSGGESVANAPGAAPASVPTVALETPSASAAAPVSPPDPEPSAAPDATPASTSASAAAEQEPAPEAPPSTGDAPIIVCVPAIPSPADADSAGEAAAGSETAAPAESAPSPEPEPAKTRIYTRMRAKAAGSPAVQSPEAAEASAGVGAPETSPSAAEAPVPLGAPDATATRQSPETASTLPLEDGYTYMRAPLPAACGLSHCLLGVRTEEGRVASMRCAMPAAYSPTPPQGMEGCVWLSAGDGSEGGYWVYTVRN